MEVINECDVLFWVVDVNSGTVNRSSISRIKDDLRKPIIVVINKVDTKSTSDVDKVESLIRNTFKEEGVAIENIIRFSSNAPLSDIMNPIKSVRRESARESFISLVEDDLQQLSSIFDKGVKDANKEYNTKNKEAQKITDKYNNAMSALWDACNEAAGIPHWETHMFSSDRYEMSQEEGNALMGLLEDIATTKANSLANIYNEEMDAVGEAQQAYSDMLDLKAAWQKIDDCVKEFKKVSKSLR